VSGGGGEAGGDMGDDAVAGGVSIAVMGRSVDGWGFCRHGVAGFVVAWQVVLSWWPWQGLVLLLVGGAAAGMALVLLKRH
jgi:hypothetical protein